jgi:hypothetical protein
MSLEPQQGMSRQTALRLEYSIIALGVLALVMIFQPFSIGLFTIGSMVVVLAGLINNLLPLAQPGVKVRSVVTVAMVVAMIFCIVLLVSIVVAHLYGVFFLKPPEVVAAKQALQPKFWMHPFVWSVAGVGVVLAGLIRMRTRS